MKYIETHWKKQLTRWYLENDKEEEFIIKMLSRHIPFIWSQLILGLLLISILVSKTLNTTECVSEIIIQFSNHFKFYVSLARSLIEHNHFTPVNHWKKKQFKASLSKAYLIYTIITFTYLFKYLFSLNILMNCQK